MLRLVERYARWLALGLIVLFFRPITFHHRCREIEHLRRTNSHFSGRPLLATRRTTSTDQQSTTRQCVDWVTG